MPSDSSNTWTSRRRLVTALSCRVPDRVPLCTYELAGFNSQAWENHEPSYARLMERIRRDADCAAMWNPASNARFLESAHPVEIEQTIARSGSRSRTTTTLHTPKGDLRRATEEDDGVHTTWIVEPWCKTLADVDKAMSVPFAPAEFDASDFARISGEVGDRGIVMATLSDPALVAAELMSFQDFLAWAYEWPDHFARITTAMAERVMENLRRQLDACVVDLYRIVGPEYFTPPCLPPEWFRRNVVPHVTAMTRLIHERGSKVRLHCHGKIARVLDMIFDTEPDGLDPCEPPPDGDVELDEVKRRCAERRVSVWGNTELRLLEGGTPDEVRAAVRRAMDQARQGGGFILMPTAAPINVPLSPRTEANYFAWLDAGLEFGRY